MEKFGDNITRQLKKIREELGLSPADFVVPHPQVDKWIKSGDVRALFDEKSRLLLHNGTPVFVYIRDHVVGVFSLHDPAGLKKIHFTTCSTLKDMQGRGKFGRYQLTNRDDNKYTIEFRGGREHDVKLHPCKNCLDELRYQGFSYDDMPLWKRQSIVLRFDAKESIDYIRDYFREFTAGQRRDFEPAGYPRNWSTISYSHRQRKGFICEDEECGVDLTHYPHLADCHHEGGVKTDCRDENLRCLCKECHQKRDPHYKVSKEDLAIIREERRKQGK